MHGPWTPPLEVRATAGGCRLSLGTLAHGDGATLQDAADDLVARLLRLALAFRSTGFAVAPDLGPPDRRLLDLLWELTEMTARGEDIRPRLFGAGAAG